MASQSPRHMASNVSRSADYQNRQIISFPEIPLRFASSTPESSRANQFAEPRLRASAATAQKCARSFLLLGFY